MSLTCLCIRRPSHPLLISLVPRIQCHTNPPQKGSELVASHAAHKHRPSHREAQIAAHQVEEQKAAVVSPTSRRGATLPQANFAQTPSACLPARLSLASTNSRLGDPRTDETRKATPSSNSVATCPSILQSCPVTPTNEPRRQTHASRARQLCRIAADRMPWLASARQQESLRGDWTGVCVGVVRELLELGT